MASSSNGLGNLPFKQDNRGSTPLDATNILVRCDRSHTWLLPIEVVGSSPTARANTVLPQRQREWVESPYSPSSSLGSSTNTTVAQWMVHFATNENRCGFESCRWCQYDCTPMAERTVLETVQCEFESH